MGNSSQNKTNDLLRQGQQKSQGDYEAPLSEVGKRSRTSYDSSRGMLSGLQDRFTSLSDTGGFSPDSFDRIRQSYGGGGGGSSVASMLSGTGGIDESKFADALAGYKDFASSGGGVDAEGIRQRSYRAIPQFYKNMQNEMERRRSVNPYAPTFDAEGARMARQSGQQTQENIRDTELAIGDKVREGREFGIKGLGDLNTNIQGMIQHGKIAGGEQELGNAQLGEARAGRATNAELAIMNALQEGKLKGLGGLAGLFDTENSNASGYLKDWFGGLGGRDNSQLGFISNRQNTTPWWKTLLQAGGSAAGAYMGGRGGR